jgi:hypothetical protein
MPQTPPTTPPAIAPLFRPSFVWLVEVEFLELGSSSGSSQSDSKYKVILTNHGNRWRTQGLEIGYVIQSGVERVPRSIFSLMPLVLMYASVLQPKVDFLMSRSASLLRYPIIPGSQHKNPSAYHKSQVEFAHTLL